MRNLFSFITLIFIFRNKRRKIVDLAIIKARSTIITPDFCRHLPIKGTNRAFKTAFRGNDNNI